jgi:hypothetical protein
MTTFNQPTLDSCELCIGFEIFHSDIFGDEPTYNFPGTRRSKLKKWPFKIASTHTNLIE